MNKTLRKTLRTHKRNVENLSGALAGIDYDDIRLQRDLYLRNLLETNQRLLKDFKIDNLIVF